MAGNIIVDGPGAFAPVTAIGTGRLGESYVPVDNANPLPTRVTAVAAQSQALSGTMNASGSAGPFVPELGRAIVVTLSGAWTGTVTLLRSRDGGTTQLPLTQADGTARAVWIGPVNAAVAEESVAGTSYFLAFARTSGTLSYRLEQ